VIRERSAQLYNEMATAAEAAGWSMLFAVGTHRHHLGKALSDSFSMTSTACQATLQGRFWRSFKRDHHYVGMVRTIEVNYGWRNGWHDHWQSLLFFKGELPDDDVRTLGEWWFRRWDAVCTSQGFGPLVEGVGLTVERLRSEDRIGDYLSKPAGTWGIGRELARGDVKRVGETFPAFDLLAPETLPLWLEYEDVTRGRRFRMSSPGLQKALLGESVPEETDEALASSEGSGATLLCVEIGGDEWGFYVQSGLVGYFLEGLELVARVLVLMSVLSGHEVVPVEWAVGEVSPGDELSQADGKERESCPQSV
jgi:hypothetical protein